MNNLICGVFHDFKPLALLQNIKQPVEEILILGLLKTTSLQKCFLHFVIRLIVPNCKTCHM